MALVENLGSLLQNGITLVAMAGVLFQFGWWVPLALVASTIPALWVVLRFAVRQHRWLMATTPDVRRSWYYDWLLTHREAAPEIRLFDLGVDFSRRFGAMRTRLRGERIDLARSQAAAEMAAGCLRPGHHGRRRRLDGGPHPARRRHPGRPGHVLPGLCQGQRLMRSLLETVGEVVTNTLFLENLFEFLELEPELTDPPDPKPPPTQRPPSVRFSHVTFRYPSSERPILDGFNLEVAAGQVAALLGVNGAGKSTLFKLLCRLYDPSRAPWRSAAATSATCAWPTSEDWSPCSSRSRSATPRPSAATSNSPTPPPPSIPPGWTPPSTAGGEALVERLPNGIDTLLGSWFPGGTELSGGEWQRIALARAVLRDAPVILLDEPTRAMDSWAETDWVNRFRDLAQGRTAVIISHRLTTAMKADIIHVMEGGRIIESGSHAELLELGGRYAEAWHAQMDTAGP